MINTDIRSSRTQSCAAVSYPQHIAATLRMEQVGRRTRAWGAPTWATATVIYTQSQKGTHLSGCPIRWNINGHRHGELSVRARTNIFQVERHVPTGRRCDKSGVRRFDVLGYARGSQDTER